MNSTHRKSLNKMVSALEQIKADLEEMSGEQTDFLDGKSDKWRESDRGCAEQDRLDALESAVQSIEEAIDSINTAEAQPE